MLSISANYKEVRAKHNIGDSGVTSKMISDEYNFEKFLDAMLDKNVPEIIASASSEAEAAARLSSSSTRGIDRATKMRIGYYKKRVGEFAFFMSHGIKPGGVDEEDFKLYRPICENLVKKGNLKSSILDQFE